MARDRWAVINRRAVAVGLLMALVHVAALWIVAGADTASNRSSSPATGGVLVAVLVLETLVIVAVWRHRSLLPGWVRRTLVRLAKAVAILVMIAIVLVGVLSATPLEFAGYLCAFAVWCGLVFGLGVDSSLVNHNLFALAAAVIGAVLLGTALGPAPMIVLLVLLLAWDHVAVNLSDVMGDLVEASAVGKIPNYFVIPASTELELADVRKFVRDIDDVDERPDGLAGIIGVGDFVIPTALVVSFAYEAGTVADPVAVLAAAGIFASIPVLSAADGPTPALPYLNGGALVGVVAGVVLFPATLGVLI